VSDGSTFDSTKRPIQTILEEIRVGKTQLPDFQRGWVWDDDRIKSLLASVSMAFPIGALMTLENGGEGVRFKPRPVEGSDPALAGASPETLILDGQQRLTSLFQALISREPVQTRDAKGKRLSRWYYIDMRGALSANGDREEAIRSVPEDRIVRTFGGEPSLDISTPEKEYEQCMFPASSVFDAAPWRRRFNQYWRRDSTKIDLYDGFESEVLERFKQYNVPVIKLAKETPKEAVCLVFEKVNTGGVSLTVFELLTAAFAAENFQLRDDWRKREDKLKKAHPVLHTVQSDDFLQAIALLVTQERRREAEARQEPEERTPGIGCKRRDILRLTVAAYEAWADSVQDGFVRAARFLHQQKIFRAKDLPYRTQLVPLTVALVALGSKGETEGARRKLARWYWCGVLGELYGGATETRFARDLPELVAYVGSGPEPSAIVDGTFAANRLLSLRTRNSAAYKGIYALLMRDGGRDFRSGEPIEAQAYFDDKMDIHHIFPEKWCQGEGIDPRVYNSIINKTAISARTNRKIGGKAPTAYLEALERDASVDRKGMDVLLASHVIPAEQLRDDDFGGFFQERAEALLQRIEAAMGKVIARDEAFRFDASLTAEYDDGPAEWDAEEPVETEDGE